jgi:hypothetical protein
MTIRAVHGVFGEGLPVFPGSAILSSILDRAQVQIAVREPSLIESSEILTSEDP